MQQDNKQDRYALDGKKLIGSVRLKQLASEVTETLMIAAEDGQTREFERCRGIAERAVRIAEDPKARKAAQWILDRIKKGNA